MAELHIQVRPEREKEWKGESVTVKEVLVPTIPVFLVCELNVQTHNRGNKLCEEEDEEASQHLRVEFDESAGAGGCFTLEKRN